MKTLALDTSTLMGSVALMDDDALLAEKLLSVSIQHSERVMPAVDELLSQSQVSLQDIDLLAVTVGPGSFTGLRIGLSVMQGFSSALQKPLAGVNTLQALALNGWGFSGRVVTLMNAFRQECYVGQYRFSAASLDQILVEEEKVILEKQLSELFVPEQGPYLILGYHPASLKEALTGRSDVVWGLGPQNHTRASHVALLAREQFQKGALPLPHTIVPLYFRQPG